MEKIKIRHVPHGQIYRPVFDAEEQLIQSFKSRKAADNSLPSSRCRGPSSSGDYFEFVSSSADRYEFESDNASAEVHNLPDILPTLVREKPSENLRRMHDRRSVRHQSIVEEFDHKLDCEMKFFNDKIREMSDALKTRLDLNYSDINVAIMNFDNEEILQGLTDAKLEEVWQLCKATNDDNMKSIQELKEGFFKLQPVQTTKITAMLQETLQLLLKNSFLPKNENYKVIETESMLLNATNLANTRSLSRIVLNLIEQETHRSIQNRINFSERKAKWIQYRIDNRISKFCTLLEAEDSVSPPGVKAALENLRQKQKSLIDQRNDALLQLGSINPDNENAKSFEKWADTVEKLQDEIDSHIEGALTEIKAQFRNVSNMLYDEEKKFHDDLAEIVDPGDMEVLVRPYQDQVDALIDSHYMELRQLNINFEDLSSRTANQMAVNGKLYSELVSSWIRHWQETQSRHSELKGELDHTRSDFDESYKKRESHISNKIDELRQADEQEKIEKKEAVVEGLLNEALTQFKHFQNRQSNTITAHAEVIARELEYYQLEIEKISNLPDDFLSEMDKYVEREDTSKSLLSDLSKQAGEKWDWILRKRLKDKIKKDEVTADDDTDILRKFKRPTRVTALTQSSKQKASTKTTPRSTQKPTSERPDSGSVEDRASDMMYRAVRVRSFYWDDKGYILKKREKKPKRKPEVPPISWFYETGGISPIPRNVWLRTNGPGALSPKKERLPSLTEEAEASEEPDFKTRIFQESEIKQRNEAFEPFSFVAMHGDEALNHSDCLPVFRENIIKEADLVNLRNDLRLCFVKHYEVWRNDLLEKGRKEQEQKFELFQNEYALNVTFHSDRMKTIKRDVSKVRQDELKFHLLRLQRHENQALLKMKEMLQMVNQTKVSAENIVLQLKQLDNPQTSKYIGKFMGAKKEKDLIKVKQEMDDELDAVINKLGENYNLFIKNHCSGVREIRDSSDCLLKSLKLFKNGGNFSRAEIENFKGRIKKLDSKLARFDGLQVVDVERILPEQIEKVEQTRKNLMEIYNVHHKDVTVNNTILKITRESHVLIGSEIARMQKSIKDKYEDLHNLETEFSAYWSPTYNVKSCTADELHAKLKEFKLDLNKIVTTMKMPEKSTTLPADFYKKWLKGIDEDWQIRSIESTPRLNKRMSHVNINTNLSRRASQLGRSPKTGQSTPGGKHQKATEPREDPGKIVRRKLLDAKSEIKQQIFGFHVKPATHDFPTAITGLLFDKTTKIIDIYDDYYKNKGLRPTTRPDLSDNFEKSGDKVRQEIHEQETRAIHKSVESYDLLMRIINHTEELYVELPKIIFDHFINKLKNKIDNRLKEIKFRREMLMEALEEAKREHFESIRINIGHPSYGDQLSDLNAREATRRKKHTKATKERADLLTNSLTEEIEEGLMNLNNLIKRCFLEFDEIQKSSDVMPDDSDYEGKMQYQLVDGERLIVWSPLEESKLPKFDRICFTSKRETYAHHELDNRKNITMENLKTYYETQKNEIKEQEDEQLSEIQRWLNFWKLQISEIKACFED